MWEDIENTWVGKPENCGIYRTIPRDFSHSTREFAFNKLHNVRNLMHVTVTYKRDGAVKPIIYIAMVDNFE